MAEDTRFFSETDPEWAVAQLTTQAPSPATSRRAGRLPWARLGGGAAALVIAAGAAVALAPSDDGPTAPTAAVPVTPVATSSPPQPTARIAPLVAPQVTLAAVPRRPRPRPEPPPQPTYVPPSYTPPAAATPTPERDPKPVRSGRPGNQVGPNRPLKTPWSPREH